MSYLILDTTYSYEELAYKRNLSYIKIIKEFLAEHYDESGSIDSTITSILPNEIERIYYQIYNETGKLIAEDGDVFFEEQYYEHLNNRVKYDIFDHNEEEHFFLAVKDINVNSENYTIAVAIRAFELELEFYGIKLIYLFLFILLVPIIAF